VWNSPYFNAVALSVIVSSFFFTFNDLQNVDPEMDSFYQRVDLIYTIIFAAGNCLHLLRVIESPLQEALTAGLHNQSAFQQTQNSSYSEYNFLPTINLCGCLGSQTSRRPTAGYRQINVVHILHELLFYLLAVAATRLVSIEQIYRCRCWCLHTNNVYGSDVWPDTSSIYVCDLL
jgi:hypothetical protein